LREQIIASEMPVLPEVGSRIVWPGRIAPFSSASSISARGDAVLDRARSGCATRAWPRCARPAWARALELDERRVADRLHDVAVAAAARAVLQFLRHSFKKCSCFRDIA
jgi:hypothetical protein